MSKSYNEMTQAERTADRIAKNKANREAVAPVIRAQAYVASVKNERKVGQLLAEFHAALPDVEKAPFVHFLTTLRRK